jgi:hypothetical protein
LVLLRTQTLNSPLCCATFAEARAECGASTPRPPGVGAYPLVEICPRRCIRNYGLQAALHEGRRRFAAGGGRGFRRGRFTSRGPRLIPRHFPVYPQPRRGHTTETPVAVTSRGCARAAPWARREPCSASGGAEPAARSRGAVDHLLHPVVAARLIVGKQGTL